MSVDLVRIVDSIHRDKNIPKDILFDGIQSALTTAARKHYPDAAEIEVHIDRDTGAIDATKDGVKMDPSELGRISAQTAKQVIIQKIREAERDSLFDEFEDQRGDLVTGTVQRFEGGAVIVNLGKTDGILPRGEQIPGESYHPNERIRAIILDVRKVGQRVKIILSRTHPDFVRRLFELEIPEIADQIIAIRALRARPDTAPRSPSPRSTPRSTPSAPASAFAAPESRTSSMSWAASGSTSSAGTSRSRS